jgi:hypothetical protein
MKRARASSFACKSKARFTANEDAVPRSVDGEPTCATITCVVGCIIGRAGGSKNKCNNTVKVLITLESMLGDRECYYILALVNKLVRSFSVITDPLVRVGEYPHHLM